MSRASAYPVLTLSYDNNGNLTAYGDTTYAWNYCNALTEVEGSE